MAVGEYISVSSQRDSEQADIEKERVEQAKGACLATLHPWVLRHTILQGSACVWNGRNADRDICRQPTANDVARPSYAACDRPRRCVRSWPLHGLCWTTLSDA